MRQPGNRAPGDRAPAPGRLAFVQDLVNTADLEAGRDRLRTVDQLEVFCIDHGLGEVGAEPADVAAARALREALRDLCGARVAPPGAPQPGAPGSGGPQELVRLFSAGPLVLALDPAGNPTPVPARGLTGADLLVAHAAAAVLQAAADGTWRRLKACEAEPCRWVFYDHSPAGRGRWCSMSICGARAKMRAYRRRR